MRIYLDNCCFNRPFDKQDDIKVRLETEAKLNVQAEIKAGKMELVWSYILDYENSFNPSEEKQNIINEWRIYAVLDLSETNTILETANELQKINIKSKDALHIACAVEGKCSYFLTTDKFVLKKATQIHEKLNIHVINPIDFVLL
jgi:predicted nucleic acid-binding protein